MPPVPAGCMTFSLPRNRVGKRVHIRKHTTAFMASKASALQLQRLARDLIARVRWVGFRVASRWLS